MGLYIYTHFSFRTITPTTQTTTFAPCHTHPGPTSRTSKAPHTTLLSAQIAQSLHNLSSWDKQIEVTAAASVFYFVWHPLRFCGSLGSGLAPRFNIYRVINVGRTFDKLTANEQIRTQATGVRSELVLSSLLSFPLLIRSWWLHKVRIGDRVLIFVE